ncbi:hypothetical protein OVS_02525 [Mycoplasma ovis str. Michigan]|uniref:Uncharacterized protein n=1 Tax=Mycoplasma ovis str. Michigan TaxID=1415773 RepID=A0ABM5P1V7_9MOLU|nr:hypothetical protein [Mycoplasma ovis]AHC40343.1 hypothetical protein OVS_02525 [Mycoplasma ovis str. Michigan]
MLAQLDSFNKDSSTNKLKLSHDKGESTGVQLDDSKTQLPDKKLDLQTQD